MEGTFEYRSGLDAGEALLSQANRPTAIFAGNDEMAAGLIAAAHKFGLSVPQDFYISGFDDSVVATVVCCPLTTVCQPIKDMATTAVSSVIEKLRGQAEDTPDVKHIKPSIQRTAFPCLNLQEKQRSLVAAQKA